MDKEKEVKILLDADVIRHFLKGGKILLLSKIYPGRFAILDTVQKELCRSTSIATQVNNFLQFSNIEILKFPSKMEVQIEYAKLIKSGLGVGESACMATAKFDKSIIASSNLRDIKKYCEENEIVYLTTMDILVEAYEKGIMNEAECDLFIYDVKSKKSILPCNTMKEFIQKFKSIKNA